MASASSSSSSSRQGSAPAGAAPAADGLPARRDPHAAVIADLQTWQNKAYLGGFRSRRNRYYHAQTQTLTAYDLKAMARKEHFHRDAQTVFIHNRTSQTVTESGTQMTKTGCYVSPEGDKVLVARPYITADERHAQKVAAVITLQCWVRVIYAKRLVRFLRHKRDVLLQEQQRQAEHAVYLMGRAAEKARRAKMNPRTQADFDVLYHGLELWRRAETERIKASYTGDALTAELLALTNQQTDLLCKMEALKQAAATQHKARVIDKKIEAMSTPRTIQVPVMNNKIVSVAIETPTVRRAQELRAIYEALGSNELTIDERLSLLLTVKHTVKEFDCNLTRDMVDLVDREADQMRRGRPAAALEGCRARLRQLMVQFIENPEFNPVAVWYSKPALRGLMAFTEGGLASGTHPDRLHALVGAKVYLCKNCGNYRASTDFALSTTQQNLGRCKECTREENIGVQRADDAVYATMLQDLLERERASPQGDALASMLHENDIRYLVEHIWASSSAISGICPMNTLTLVRWDSQHPFSPWNSVLLTYSEGAEHLKVSPDAVYGAGFLEKVRQRQLLARKHFTELLKMSKTFKTQLGIRA
ncbi:hypothetical protein CXG81DRAFT_13586 [Caulochytrium protostelioides]|uniref:IQ motif and ubiquitin-like domain-containing protein n=1 Tax=Caulochytrium protostelioides TaxID=1555241 RepID=A0A4P9X4Y4_9FUNG|nr:hypothetical protein CXG81DRAFT_13586 [Caulochytrium protostelioides]|eukprot:RKP00135.1 hypothetical protein CXG81DRAFT_13586 [Caulochytrium protostelioides]